MGNGNKKHKKAVDTSLTIESVIISEEDMASPKIKDYSIAEIMAENSRKKTPTELIAEEHDLQIQSERVNAETAALILPVQKELEEKVEEFNDNNIQHLFKPYQPRKHQQTTGCFSFLFSLFSCRKDIPNEEKQSLLIPSVK